MKIYVAGKRNIELEKLNSQRNTIIYVTLLEAILKTLFKKGSIVYSERKNKGLDICEKILKIPYLYGKIENILEFENHYSKVKKI